MSALPEIVPISNFGFDAQRRILSARQSGDKVITLCPLSISMACGMALRGTPPGTSTRDGFIKALQLYGAQNHLRADAGYFNLQQLLQDKDLGVRLDIANLLLTKQGLQFKPEYLEALQRNFQAEVRAVDFSTQQTIDDANAWVKKSTNEKIDKVADNFPADIVAFIGNCVYFKGDWSTPFDKSLTKEHAFHLDNGRQKDHPLMYRKDHMPYAQLDDCQMVALPFGKSERVIMAVLLPDRNNTVDKLAASLTGDTFWDAVDSLSPVKGELWLPRFEAKYERELNDVLMAQGMRQAFTPGKADFSDMTDGRVHISKVMHKTYIKVDEVGAEAAGLTGMVMESLCAPSQPPFKMKVDRPALYVIGDPLTRTVFFTCAVYEPEDGK